MFFAHAMDDTSMTSIRRSIFLFCSFIAFAAAYGLKIDPSAPLFGMLKVDEGMKIPTEKLVLMASIVQVYLCIRLIISRPIAFALLQKSWGLEDLKSDDKFVELVDDIKDMVRSSGSVEYPAQSPDGDIKDVLNDTLQKMKLTLNNFEQTGSLLSENLRVHKELVTSNQLADESFRKALRVVEKEDKATEQRIMERSFEKEHIARNKEGEVIVGASEPVISPEVWRIFKSHQELFPNDFTSDIQKKLKSMQEALQRSYVEAGNLQEKLIAVQEHIEYCNEFPQIFDQHKLNQAMNGMSGELVAIKSKREREFHIFEFGIPLAVGIISIGFGFYYYALQFFPAAGDFPLSDTFAARSLDEIGHALKGYLSNT